MRRVFSLLLLLLLLVVAALTHREANAQTAQSIAAAEMRPAQVTVTFTFQSPLADYSVYAGDVGESRYYIRVQTTNIPSFKVTPTGAPVRVMVDNSKSSHESLLFWIPVTPGTAPRIDRNQSDLSLTFAPAYGSSEAWTESVGGTPTQSTLTSAATPRGATANSSATAGVAPVPQPSATPVLVGVAPFNPDTRNLSFADADLAVPESPAFTVLGLTPETVVRPSSPREFASSLLSGVDRHGNFQSGVALDSAPYLSFAGDQITLGQYRASYKVRFLSRTQFSFGSTKGASEDDKSARLALGLRFTLWDRGDPHSDKDLMECFRTVGNDLLSIPSPSVLEPDNLPPTATQVEKVESTVLWQEYNRKKAEFDAGKNQRFEECRAEGRKRNWNKSSWIVAFAPSWISTTGLTKNFKWNGAGFWTSIAYGFEGFPKLQKLSQLIFHARYRNNEQVPDPENQGQFLVQDSYFFGTRLRVGTENSTANFEGVFIRTRPNGKQFDNSARYSLGLERRVAENLWFALAFGGENGRQDGKNNGFVLTSFKWGFAQKRTISSVQ